MPTDLDSMSVEELHRAYANATQNATFSQDTVGDVSPSFEDRITAIRAAIARKEHNNAE